MHDQTEGARLVGSTSNTTENIGQTVNCFGGHWCHSWYRSRYQYPRSWRRLQRQQLHASDWLKASKKKKKNSFTRQDGFKRLSIITKCAWINSRNAGLGTIPLVVQKKPQASLWGNKDMRPRTRMFGLVRHAQKLHICRESGSDVHVVKAQGRVKLSHANRYSERRWNKFVSALVLFFWTCNENKLRVQAAVLNSKITF